MTDYLIKIKWVGDGRTIWYDDFFSENKKAILAKILVLEENRLKLGRDFKVYKIVTTTTETEICNKREFWNEKKEKNCFGSKELL